MAGIQKEEGESGEPPPKFTASHSLFIEARCLLKPPAREETHSLMVPHGGLSDQTHRGPRRGFFLVTAATQADL